MYIHIIQLCEGKLGEAWTADDRSSCRSTYILLYGSNSITELLPHLVRQLPHILTHPMHTRTLEYVWSDLCWVCRTCTKNSLYRHLLCMMNSFSSSLSIACFVVSYFQM